MRTYQVLLATLLVLLTALWWKTQQHRTSPLASDLNNASSLRIVLAGKSTHLIKNTMQGSWQLDLFEGRTTKDQRANVNLISHLIDLIGSLGRTNPIESLDPKLAAEYGALQPTLLVEATLKDSSVHTIIFGHRDLSGDQAFAFFPEQRVLMPVPSVTLALFEGKTPLDLRDRRITTFNPDDLEDLEASGKCLPFTLHRDGDRWVSKPGLRQSQIDAWLEAFLSMYYEDLDENARPESKVVCKFVLSGRKGRKETLFFYQKQNSVWATNSNLSAHYRLKADALERLLSSIQR